MKRTIIGVICSASILLASCAAGGNSNVAPIDHSRTVIFGIPQEPPIINTYLANGAQGVTQMMTEPLHDKWVRMDDTSTWQPQLATTVPSLKNGGVTVGPDSTTIRFSIRQRAKWSDNVPIECDDLVFTWKTIMSERWQISTRLGWREITSITCPTPHKVVMHLRGHYAPFLSSILDSHPLPRHALEGRNFNTYWNNRVTISSGPFIFESWKRGVDLRMRRNPNYWNDQDAAPNAAKMIVFKFVPDASTLKLQLRMEEVDMVALQPDSNLPTELARIPGVETSIVPGAGWEQLTYNMERAPTNNVHVRRAIAYSINRQTIADVVLRKQVTPLQSTLLVSQKPMYEPLWQRYDYAPQRVAQELQKAGYRRTGKFWTKDGKRLTLQFATTAGNPLRARLAQLLQVQLARSGIEMQIKLYTAEIFFSQIITHSKFNLSEFSFRTISDPSQSEIFACDQIPRAPNYHGKNDFRYCNRTVDELLRAADAELVPEKRAQLIMRMQRILATDIPTLPLYQPPDTLAYAQRVGGVRANAVGLHTWNADEWTVSEP